MPDAIDVTQVNKFTVEGEKRYWLRRLPSSHFRVELWRAMDSGVAGIALGRDLNDDVSVDVLGTQLEEVIE